MSRWYRAYEGTVTDAKLGEVALVAGCSRSVAIAAWHALLESAAGTNDGGRFEVTARRVAVILTEPLQVIEAVLSEFEAMGMIEGSRVSAWEASFCSQDFRRTPHWRVIREAVFRRDNFTCAYCGEYGKKLQCDHIVPISRGGSNSFDNLTTACRSCNASKRDKLISEWVQ